MGLVFFFFLCWQQRGSLFQRGRQRVPGFNLPLVCPFIHLLLQPIAYGPGAGQDRADHGGGADAPLGTGAMGSSLLQSSSRGLNPARGSTSIHNIPGVGVFWQLSPTGISERVEDASWGVTRGGQRLLQPTRTFHSGIHHVGGCERAERVPESRPSTQPPQPSVAPGKPVGSWRLR